MALYRHVHTLMEVGTPSSVSETGEAHVILPFDSDRTEDRDQGFAVFIDVMQTGGSSAPSVTVGFQTSHDGASWVDAITPIQQASDGTKHHFVAVEGLGPFVRALTVLAGNPRPTHTVKVVLASSANFRLKPVPIPNVVEAVVKA